MIVAKIKAAQGSEGAAERQSADEEQEAWGLTHHDSHIVMSRTQVISNCRWQFIVFNVRSCHSAAWQ